MRAHRIILASVIAFATGAVARTAAPATGPTSLPAPAPWIEQVPAGPLSAMYRREIGPGYDPGAFARLHEAHRLVEDYFRTPGVRDRAGIVRRLEATGVDPNMLGRIARVRLDWPAFPGGGVFYVNERVGPHHVRYFLGLPKGYDRATPWPLLVKLPTAQAFVTDPRPTADEVARIYTAWVGEELAAHPDAAVLMPLLNLDELYGPSYVGMNTVVQPILHATGRANIDPARVYLSGHSMAGHAVWNLGLHYPTYFAAINPLAGGATADWQRVRLPVLRNTLPVVWQDATDPVQKPDVARAIVAALRKAGVDVEYDETKGLGHAPPPDVVARAYDKMRGRARDLYPPRLTLQSTRPDTLFNRVDWLQVYQPVEPGPERRLIFGTTAGRMIVNANAVQVDVARTARNRIELNAGNVASLRLYVNDQTVDFATPVVVVVNKRERFNAVVKPSVDQMLKDQIFLGRGWRYFTGVIDIDLLDAPATRPTTRVSTAPATRPATAPPPPKMP